MKRIPRLLPLTPQEYKKTGKYTGYLRKKYAFQDTPLTEVEVFQKWILQKGNLEGSEGVGRRSRQERQGGIEDGKGGSSLRPVRSRLKQYHPQLVRGGNRKRSRTRDLSPTESMENSIGRDQVQVKETTRKLGSVTSLRALRNVRKELVQVQNQLEDGREERKDPHAFLSRKRKDSGRAEREDAWDQLQLQKERSWWRAGWSGKESGSRFPYPGQDQMVEEESPGTIAQLKFKWKAGWKSSQRGKLRNPSSPRSLQAKSRGKLNRHWSLRGKKGRSILSSSISSVPSPSRRSKRKRLRA